MTTNKMLIDASHPEETRVVVLRDGRVEEFDYESTAREQLRGNIYLAKVTRVEPSLQAAFVDYGGNRHGFLAFSEIHPDYYQIPVADRQALLEEEAAENVRDTDEDEVEEGADSEADKNDNETEEAPDDDEGGAVTEGREGEYSLDEEGAPGPDDEKAAAAPKSRSFAERFLAPLLPAEYLTTAQDKEEAKAATFDDAPEPHGLVEDTGVEEVDSGDDGSASGETADEAFDEIGEGDALEEVPVRRRRRKRYYKIQEVIKRGQIILVQVVKEERGNKGAALTTYMSLAGRYTVLMPNTARGGGISRKITNATDRNHLRKIANAIEVPDGMGLIIRTAGASRTMAQIKRDYEYLSRLWEKVRNLTMDSIAPCRVYEEGDLIKRSIRDLYSNELDSVVVAGEEAYDTAKDFMRLIMPSHAKNVKVYKDAKPIFAKYDIERQLSAMFSPYVTLKSGGYLVINQTEALVAIDINSGKSTRQFSIEETALNTNLEASEEIARQLKLRDLAGLIVIDYIDMEERSNNRAVERCLKSSLQGDRARIQVGRISHFGLLEMSRQRLRTGVLEGSTSPCAQCQGTGIIRSTESVALSVLRALEDALIGGETSGLKANTSVDVALYILNSKRESLSDIEQRYGVEIGISANDKLQGGNFSIERIGSAENGTKGGQVIMTMNWGAEAPQSAGGRGDRKPRKRGGRKRGKDTVSAEKSETKPKAQPRTRKAKTTEDETVAEVSGADIGEASTSAENGTEEQAARKPRRRGRRGGRRNRGQRSATAEGTETTEGGEPTESGETTERAEAPEAGTSETSSTENGASDINENTPGEAKSAAGEDTAGETAPKAARKPRTRRTQTGRRPARSRSQSANGEAGSEASDPMVNALSKTPPSADADTQASPVKNDNKPSRSQTPRRPKRSPRTAPKAVSKAAPEQKSSGSGPVEPVDTPAASGGSQDAPDGEPKTGWWQKQRG